MIELAKLIAEAPFLKKCDIAYQINSPEINLERKKAGQNTSGFVKLFQSNDNEELFSTET